MNSRDFWPRLALLTTLVEQAPSRILGRTAIVKMVYLLQVVRGVPLGYDFRLYTYGPFDSEVLGDLEYAQALKAVESKTVLYSTGYGYDVSPGPKASAVKTLAKPWLDKYQSSIDWVVREFGGWTASQLELFSTIVYVDREFAAQGQRHVSVEEMVQRVREVKPHFPEAQVEDLIRQGQEKECVSTIARSQANRVQQQENF